MLRKGSVAGKETSHCSGYLMLILVVFPNKVNSYSALVKT